MAESHFIVQRLHTGALLRVSSSDTLALGRTQLGASYAHVSREQARLSVSSASILHVEHLGRPTNPTVIRMCGGAEEVLSDRGSIYSVIAGDSIILDYKQPVETAFLVKGHGPPPRPLPSPSSVPVAAAEGLMYIGIDVSERQVRANYEELRAVKSGPSRLRDISYDPTWVVGDGENIVELFRVALKNKGLHPTTQADFICTCPPYWCVPSSSRTRIRTHTHTRQRTV